MKKIDKNTKILFILTIIFFIFVVGVSLALPDFLVNLQGINVNKLESCKLNVTLTDENAINLVSAYPMDDNDALKGKPYKVTLTKTGNCENYGYVLNMKSSCDDCTKTDGKCTIGESTCDCNNQLSSNLIRYYVKDNSTNKKYTGNNPYNMNISGSFEDGEDEKTFDILLWIDKDATNSDLVNSNGVAKDFCSKLGAEVTEMKPFYNMIANQVQKTAISYKYINDANARDYTMVDNPTNEQINSCTTAILDYFEVSAEDENYEEDYSTFSTLCSSGNLGDTTLTALLNMGFIPYDIIEDTGIVLQGDTIYNVNDNGVFLYNGTDDNGGNKPIYYYRGNVNNNNVLFANKCWKIVRTTSTGGTKLIYNGVPSNGTCNSTGENSLIGISVFNTNYNSPADVGYMYGTRYIATSKDMSSVTDTYKYGNDVTYSNGTYTLTGKTMNSTSWSADKATLADGYHYTCLNSTGTCTEVYYITEFDIIDSNGDIHYLTFTGGDTLETAKTKMFTNTTDSVIKGTIDDWYEDNLTDYTSYLENTIFCNDRTYTNKEITGYTDLKNGGAMYSKDKNASAHSGHTSAANLAEGTPSLQCTSVNDRFSLKVANGGTSGYGNNTLTYPVGLLTSDEVNLAGSTDTTTGNSNYYLYLEETDFWLLSPSIWSDMYSYVERVRTTGELGGSDVNRGRGVRPVVSLRSEAQILRGTGTSLEPYIIAELN